MRFDLFTGGAGFVFNSSAVAAVPVQIRAANINGTGATLLNEDDSVQTFNVPMSMFSASGVGGIGAAQTWIASAVALRVGVGAEADEDLAGSSARL